MMKQTALPRRWDWYAAILLVALAYTAAVRLSITNWTRELGYVEGVVVLGTLLGLALGYSRFGGRMVALLAGGYTLAQTGWQLTRVADPQLGLLDQLANGIARLAVTFGQLLDGKKIDDPIFFLAVVSLLFWGIGLSSGYGLVRGQRLFAILVAPTLPLLVVQYYDTNELNRLWIVAFYFFLLLLLIGRVNLLEKQAAWLSRRVSTANQPEFELAGSILGMAALAVLLAWLLPTPSAVLPGAQHAWQQINQPFDSTRQWFDNMLAAVKNNSQNGVETYAESMGLGTIANQGTQEVFSVTQPGVDFPRYHWRMRVYDTYDHGTWDTSAGLTQKFTPERADLPITGGASARLADFWFHWEATPVTLLPLPSQPVWVSRQGEFQYTDAGLSRVDVLSWHTDLALQTGDQYEAHAVLIDPGVESLRSAGSDYPAWVRQDDLQIPASLPDDIKALAESLTRNQATPYDKANAITGYLRTGIKYSMTLPSAPPGVEPLDWFLFTLKSGFCNYYASADVMMLRSIGIPARLAVGYAQGQATPDGFYVVHERDAHAWPEVYFPGIGWVDFEPTASQPDIARASGFTRQGTAQPPANGKGVNPPSRRPQDIQNDQNGNTIAMYPSIPVWVIISIILLSVAGGVVWLLDPKRPLGRRLPQLVGGLYQHSGTGLPNWLDRWERWSESQPVERSFHAINQSLAWLGKPQPAHVTAAERAELLKGLLPALAADIDILKEQHEQTLFSPVPGDEAKATRAAWRIRYSTVRAILRRLFGANDE